MQMLYCFIYIYIYIYIYIGLAFYLQQLILLLISKTDKDLFSGSDTCCLNVEVCEMLYCWTIKALYMQLILIVHLLWLAAWIVIHCYAVKFRVSELSININFLELNTCIIMQVFYSYFSVWCEISYMKNRPRFSVQTQRCSDVGTFVHHYCVIRIYGHHCLCRTNAVICHSVGNGWCLFGSSLYWEF